MSPLAQPDSAAKDQTSALETHIDRTKSPLALLQPDAKARLWERILHEDNLLNDRFNVFIVFESALLGVVGVLYTTRASNSDLIHVVSVLGLILTSLWIAALLKQKHIVNVLEGLIVEAEFEEYKYSHEKEEMKLFGIVVLDSALLLTVVIPMIIALLWLIPIFFI